MSSPVKNMTQVMARYPNLCLGKGAEPNNCQEKVVRIVAQVTEKANSEKAQESLRKFVIYRSICAVRC